MLMNTTTNLEQVATIDFAALPRRVRVTAAFPHGSQRGTVGNISGGIVSPTTSMDELRELFEANGYTVESVLWSHVAERRVRYSRDITLPRSRYYTFISNAPGKLRNEFTEARNLAAELAVIGKGKVKFAKHTYNAVHVQFEDGSHASYKLDQIVEIEEYVPPKRRCMTCGSENVVSIVGNYCAEHRPFRPAAPALPADDNDDDEPVDPAGDKADAQYERRRGSDW